MDVHTHTHTRTHTQSQHVLFDVLAIVKQFGVNTYFMTLSCTDLHWNELVLIIRKLKGSIGGSNISSLD